MTLPHPILITGSNRGLGLAAAKALSIKGDKIIATGRNISELTNSLNIEGIVAESSLELDFTNPNVQNTFEQINSLPPLSGVIHCASIDTGGGILSSSINELDHVGRFLSHTFALTKASCNRIRLAGGGRLILVGSMVGSPGRVSGKATPYCVYKGALRLLTEGITAEGYSDRVSGTYINLGGFRTDRVASESPKKYVSQSLVVQEIIRLLELDPNVRVEQLDLIPAGEMIR